MLQLMFDGRRKKAKALLTSRLNKVTFAEIQGSDREVDRCSVSHAVILIPALGKRGWDFEAAAPAVSRDMSHGGISLIHTAPVESENLLIGLIEGDTAQYLKCRVEHSTPLGLNFFQIGLSVEEVVALDQKETETIAAKFSNQEN